MHIHQIKLKLIVKARVQLGKKKPQADHFLGLGRNIPLGQISPQLVCCRVTSIWA